ncbi:hypothetical protein CO044_01320 [Candidatus Peregrinibacteria bacterium CG_4_9_14_0_2_um_filter_38_9]|nr:MAG: hypothetical protein CO044_01320 [Candidatus Peregrinibacteria bacterium CG_4_9_14_0_2_um_filter_38_9]
MILTCLFFVKILQKAPPEKYQKSATKKYLRQQKIKKIFPQSKISESSPTCKLFNNFIFQKSRQVEVFETAALLNHNFTDSQNGRSF